MPPPGAGLSSQRTRAVVRAPTSASPAIALGSMSSSTRVRARRRIPNGPRIITTPQAPGPRSGPLATSISSIRSPASVQWLCISARNANTSAGGAGTIREAAILPPCLRVV